MSFRMHRVPVPANERRDVRHELRLDVRRIELGAVGDEPERYQAVEIRLQVESVLPPCVLQLDYRRDVQQLIDSLVELRDTVWPQGGGG